MKQLFIKSCFSILILYCLSSCYQPEEKIEYSTVTTSKVSSKYTDEGIEYVAYNPTVLKDSVLPILYLLHGHGGNHHDWFDEEEGNIRIILDSLIINNLIPPVRAVSFNAQNSWYVNHNIPFEKIYFEELIPYFETKYLIDTSNRIIVGNSMGGYGALNYSLKHPTLFNNSILLAPAAYNPVPPELSSSRKINIYKKDNVFNDSIWQANLYRNIELNAEKYDYPTFYTSTGDDDPYEIFDVVVDLKTYFEKHDLKYEITVINGQHTWDVWRKCFTQDIKRIFNFK